MRYIQFYYPCSEAPYSLLPAPCSLKSSMKVPQPIGTAIVKA
ncbi:hypothetical protein BJP36_43865 [Moorena producens JHB]|uniref:Uncharacterized protein n=1 Tax=Moorena producens (strain JHB) TaxID=1454205 RepID=A0A9Q9STD3_MOOP1|nr:hypothetical protein [Moorena producens]WAN69296.1 hypothetical protein BJP36_43865 [Moorena producens JHB]